MARKVGANMTPSRYDRYGRSAFDDLASAHAMILAERAGTP
jgi:hypothetical protein